MTEVLATGRHDDAGYELFSRGDDIDRAWVIWVARTIGIVNTVRGVRIAIWPVRIGY